MSLVWCPVCLVCRFDSCTPCHFFDFTVISAPLSCLAVVLPVSWLSRCSHENKTKQNETNQNKNTQQVRFSICVILLSVVIFYEYITTPKAMHRHTRTHTCMHICQCKCVSAWLHRCHQFYLTSAPFRITRFNVFLKCVNELTIRASEAPLRPSLSPYALTPMHSTCVGA